MSQGECGQAMPPHPDRRVFSWWVNLLVFGLLETLILGIFFFQQRQVSNDFTRYSLDHARLVAGVIQENVHRGIRSGAVVDQVIATFLQSSGRFAAYLDSVEPFRAEELTAFAREAGLAGITIVHGKSAVAGPADWFPGKAACGASNALIQDEKTGLAHTTIALETTSGDEPSCLLLGVDIHPVLQLRRQSGLQAQLEALSAVPGIAFVRIDRDSSTVPVAQGASVRLLEKDGIPVAEARIQTSVGILEVGLDARLYSERIDQLRGQFFFIAAMLIGLGLFSSWFLYRYQQHDLQRARAVERVLARQHEEAALGRATATIAHEIRNPLNAIHMGLQRLRLESTNLDGEQLDLLAAMGEATLRTDTIINNLKRFSRPLVPDLQAVNPCILMEQCLALYRPSCQQQDIAVEFKQVNAGTIRADQQLLGELFDNLVRNSVEAQPDGGFLRITCAREKSGIRMELVNAGCRLTEEEFHRMIDPYFTTKTRGTGLGLALARRITDAHGGELTIRRLAENETLSVQIFLPENDERGSNQG